MQSKLCALALCLGALVAPAAAQPAYPDRPVTLMVPVPPGGILDTVARMVVPSMGQTLGQPVVIDNRAGAGGNIAASAVARAAPDGYTLLVGYSMFHVGNPSMYSNLTWDPLRDFVPVGMLVVSPHVVAVHPSTPVKSLRELVDYAKANPGKLNYATSGTGSVPHVGVELFKQLNHIDIVHVPYKGAGPAMQDVIAGNVQMTVATPPSVMGFVQNGKVSLLFSGFASTTDVYGGETAEINNAGALKRLRIGSLNGDKKIPGDPLTLEQVATDTTVPKLDGNLARLNNAASLLTVIQEALNSQFRPISSQISYDQSNGVVTYTADGKVYRFIPIGAPIVQVGGATASVRGNRFSASNAANTASGAFTLAGRGIQVTMGSALGYFTDLNQVLKASDPNASIRLRSNGVLQLNLGGASYLASPGSQSTSSGQTGAPAFVSDSSGFVAFRDSTGASQVMYPVFADIATVDTTIKALAPTSSTTASGDGTALLMLNGSPVTLLPQYPLIGLPTAHANDLWWQEGATFYIRYPDSTAQAFGIR